MKVVMTMLSSIEPQCNIATTLLAAVNIQSANKFLRMFFKIQIILKRLIDRYLKKLHHTINLIQSVCVFTSRKMKMILNLTLKCYNKNLRVLYCQVSYFKNIKTWVYVQIALKKIFVQDLFFVPPKDMSNSCLLSKELFQSLESFTKKTN